MFVRDSFTSPCLSRFHFSSAIPFEYSYNVWMIVSIELILCLTRTNKTMFRYVVTGSLVTYCSVIFRLVNSNRGKKRCSQNERTWLKPLLYLRLNIQMHDHCYWNFRDLCSFCLICMYPNINFVRTFLVNALRLFHFTKVHFNWPKLMRFSQLFQINWNATNATTSFN